MFNNFFGGMPQQPIYPQQNMFGGGIPQQNMPPKTNIILVTSLEDALSRYAEPNSNMLYINQDKPIGYNIMTDAQGRKVHKIIDLSDHKEETPAQVEYVTKADVEEIVKRQLEAFKKTEVIE